LKYLFLEQCRKQCTTKLRHPNLIVLILLLLLLLILVLRRTLAFMDGVRTEEVPAAIGLDEPVVVDEVLESKGLDSAGSKASPT
jgi:hypothetical protein